MPHAILIVSAQSRNEANALGEAMGWGSDNYTVKLSSREDGVTTHYGLATPVSDSFVAMYEACLEGVPPEGIPPELIAVVPLISADFDLEGLYTSPLAHFEMVIQAQGLARVA